MHQIRNVRVWPCIALGKHSVSVALTTFHVCFSNAVNTWPSFIALIERTIAVNAWGEVDMYFPTKHHQNFHVTSQGLVGALSTESCQVEITDWRNVYWTCVMWNNTFFYIMFDRTGKTPHIDRYYSHPIVTCPYTYLNCSKITGKLRLKLTKIIY